MNLRSLVAWAKANAGDLGQNLLATVALGSIAYGFALAYFPLGFIVPGVIVFGMLVAVRWRDTRS